MGNLGDKPTQMELWAPTYNWFLAPPCGVTNFHRPLPVSPSISGTENRGTDLYIL